MTRYPFEVEVYHVYADMHSYAFCHKKLSCYAPSTAGCMSDILDAHTLRSMREARGWDQATLARAAGVDQSVISRLERGIQPDLRASVLIGLARAFQTPVDALLAIPYPYQPTTLQPELVRVVADLAKLGEVQQRQAAAILRAYISTIPASDEGKS